MSGRLQRPGWPMVLPGGPRPAQYSAGQLAKGLLESSYEAGLICPACRGAETEA